MSPQVGKSPWGAEDQHGAMNLLSDKSRAAIMARVDGNQSLRPQCRLFCRYAEFPGGR